MLYVWYNFYFHFRHRHNIYEPYSEIIRLGDICFDYWAQIRPSDHGGRLVGEIFSSLLVSVVHRMT